MRIWKLLIILALAAGLLTACQSATPPAGEPDKETAAAAPQTLVLAGHDSFSVSEEVIAQFEEANNVTLQFLSLGDAGEALNKIILSKGAPLADVFFGVDNAFLSRALNADVFTPYESPQLANIPDDLKLDPENRLLPVDFGFVNINADRLWFEEQGLPLPETLEDLTKPAYAGLLVVENPATSSPGLAFLLATIGHFGEDGYLDFWRALADNDVLVSDGWSEAYFEHFTVGSGGAGDRPLVVSYSTSPPADVIYASDGRTEPASVNINPPDGTFRQIEFVGVLAGTKQPELARKLVDFMLSTPFQEDAPLQMFVYPANQDAQLPDLFVQFAEVPTDPAQVAPEAIEANREAWIQAWTDVMVTR
jgi:thiamine transport system substrate-binding protein